MKSVTDDITVDCICEGMDHTSAIGVISSCILHTAHTVGRQVYSSCKLRMLNDLKKKVLDLRKTACHCHPCAYVYKPVGHFDGVVSESMLFFPPKEQWQASDDGPPHELQHRRPCLQQIQQASASMIAAGPHDL